jgi:hypothetical protein
MRIRHSFFVACAAIAVLSAAGCKRAGQSAADAAIAAASGGKVDVNHGDDGTTTIATKDGKQTMTVSAGAGAALPASFPRDVYLPSDYKVESAMEMPNAVIAHVLTPGNLGAIAPEADRAMQAQGWTQSMLLVQSEQAHIVMWEKGERHATLTIAGDEAQGGVQVGYQLATSKQ